MTSGGALGRRLQGHGAFILRFRFSRGVPKGQGGGLLRVLLSNRLSRSRFLFSEKVGGARSRGVSMESVRKVLTIYIQKTTGGGQISEGFQNRQHRPDSPQKSGPTKKARRSNKKEAEKKTDCARQLQVTDHAHARKLTG